MNCDSVCDSVSVLAQSVLAHPSAAVSNSVLFVDPTVPDALMLVAGVAPGTAVYMFSPVADPVAQITKALMKHHPVSSVHIVSHGRSGELEIGNQWLSLDNLHNYAHQLRSWSEALTANAEILLYGCEVGKGDRGWQFVQQLSQLTGATVAASDDMTGNAELGGNWDLETSTAPIHSILPFLPDTLHHYQATLGNEFRVNTTTANLQYWSALTALADGGFVVTWSSLGQDGSDWGVYGQRYTASGTAVGSEFRINTTTVNSQRNSSVTALADGGFVVTWSSVGQDGGGAGIYGQRYAVSGETVGSEFRVNTTTAYDQDYATVTALADGGFVVTWSAGDGGISGVWGIYGQHYAASGAAIGSEFRINTTIDSDQIASASTALADGGFIVTWSSDGQDGSGYGVYAQRYNASGTPVGTEFQVNTTTTGNQGFSSVVALANGGFVFTWTDYGQDGSSNGIYGQRYDSSGIPVGTEFRVNTTTTFGSQIASSMTALTDGGFVVTWVSQDGSGNGVYGQRYAADGSSVGDEFLINQTTARDHLTGSLVAGNYNVEQLANGDLVVTWFSGNSPGEGEIFARIFETNHAPILGNEFRVNTTTANSQYWSALTALADGGFIVTWSSLGQDGSDWGIYGQRYTANGTAVGSEFRINTTIARSQHMSAITALADGGFVVTWSSFGQDGSGQGIYGQRYATNGATVGSEFRVNTTTIYDQDYTTVTALTDGGFVVTWSAGDGGINGVWGIYGQRYAASGATVGSEFRINTTTSGDQILSSVAGLTDGGFVVTWSSLGQDDSSNDIYGQRYNASGTTVGSEFRVSSNADGNTASVTGLSNGGFVVTWSSSDGSGSGVYGQRYDIRGAVVGSKFRVNTNTFANQFFSSITALSDGGFVVTWISDLQDGSGYGVYGQRYAANGTPIDGEFLVNQTTTGDQILNGGLNNRSYNLDQLVNGDLVVTWTGNGPGDDSGVFARIFEINHAPTAISLLSVTTNSFAVGKNPTEVVIGDFNNDGKADLAASFLFNPPRSPSVSVLLGDGLGSFISGGDFGEAKHPYSLAVGDFNGDGNADLVPIYVDINSVSMLLGDGAGNFTPGGRAGLGGAPSNSSAVGDLNNDGNTDLVTATSNSVSVLLGNGSGGFSPAIHLEEGNPHSSVAIGDFNGDGKADLVTVSNEPGNYDSNTVSVLLGDGLGSFAPAVNVGVSGYFSYVALGDFNGDGKADLVTTNYNSNTVSVLLGDGFGGFTSAGNINTGDRPRLVDVGDFNGDGKADLAVIAASNATPLPWGIAGEVSILLGDGSGNFTSGGTFSLGISPSSIAIGDFDGNGSDDLAISNFDSHNVLVLLTEVNNATVDENVPVGTIVGTFATTDPDTDDTFTYSLVAGTGSTDNGAFTLDGNQLKLAQSPNFEAKSSYSIRIRSTDQDGAFHEEVFTIRVNDLNEAPTIVVNNLALTTNEGQSVSNTGTFGDVDAGDTVSLAASVGTITRQRNGTWRWSYTPSDGTDQSQLVTITATDSRGAITTETFSLLVKNINPTATFSNGGAVNEGNTGTVSFSRQSDLSIVDAASLRYSYDFNNDGIWEVGDGTYANSATDSSVTVPSNFLVDGPSKPTIRGRILDKDGGFTDYTTTITVKNIAPVLTGTPATLAIGTEDTPYLITAADLLAGFTDVPGDVLSIANLKATNGKVVNNNNGTYTLTPTNNFNGIVNLNYDVIDGDGGRTAATQSFSLTPVNDAPSFTRGANQTIVAGAGAQTVANWATNFSAGPNNESAQTVQQYQIVSNSNPSLFAVAPTIDVNGNLTYTPGSSPGTATLSVRVQDNGGIANGGIDTSAAQTFTITLRPQTISLSAIDTTAAESGGDTGLYRISRNVAGGTQTIQLAIAASSTATLGNDYGFSLSSASAAAGATLSLAGNLLTVVLPNGVSSADLVLTAVDDIPAEAAETVRLNLLSGSAYTAAESMTGTVTIAQNDFVVTNTNNAGEGSLRQAVLNANAIAGANTITFAGSVFTDATPDTIALTTGELVLTDDTTILGTGANMLTINGRNASRVFSISSGVTAIVEGITIANGRANNGGGINNQGNLAISNSILRNNYTQTWGAGIWNNNILTVNNTTFQNNSTNSSNGAGGGIFNSGGTVTVNSSNFTGSTVRDGGGIFNNAGGNLIVNSSTFSNSQSNGGGGIFNALGTAIINGSTISGNRANGWGAGLWNAPGSVMTLSNSTVSGNTSGVGGGGVWNEGGNLTVVNSTLTGNRTGSRGGGAIWSNGMVNVSNSIVAGNTASVGTEVRNEGGTFTSNGYNLVGQNGNQGGFVTTTTDIVLSGAIGTAIQPLANNGGSTQTHALAVGSAAINAGSNALLPAGTTTDQRGAGFDRILGGIVDIGAVESPNFVTVSPSQSWVKGFGGTSDDFGYRLATDNAGNVYTIGTFRGTVDFDPSAGTSPLISAGGDDIFISKLDRNGNLVWAQRYGNTGDDLGFGITTDSAGNVYATGRFTGTVDFGPAGSLTSTSNYGTFITKLNSDGTPVWVKQYQGNNFSQPYEIKLDGAGNIYTTGHFSGTVDFDPSATATAPLTGQGYGDIWVSSLTNDGDFRWVKGIQGTGNEHPQRMTVDSAGNTYLTGAFFGTLDVSPNANAPNFTAGGVDSFLVKLDGGGNHLWSRHISRGSGDYAYGVAVDSVGNVYINGGIDTNSFVSKFDSAGNSLWTRDLLNSTARAISLDSAGNIYNTGVFRGIVDFDPSLGVVNLSSAGSDDIFILKLNSDGNFLSVQQAGGTGSDVAIDMTMNSLGDIYTTGYFQGATNFSPAGITSPSPTSAGGNDVFVSKLVQRSVLLGGDGNEVLQGTAANDTLIGGRGNDYLVGGSGADYFSFGTSNDIQQFLALGQDTIADFNSLEGDRIILGKGVFTALTSPAGGALVGADFATVTSDLVAGTSSATIVYNSSNGNLFYNPNGNTAGFGVGGQFAQLSNLSPLDANTFLVQV